MRPSRRTAPRERAPTTWDADQALDQLYAAHWRSLVRLAVLLVHDVALAEEVVQDSFVAMHGRWRRLRDPDRALAYLRQTVVNRVPLGAAAPGRRRAPRRPRTDRPPTRAGCRRRGRWSTTGATASSTRCAACPTASARCSRCATTPSLSEAEIADALGISRGAVKSHASRGAAALRVSLADYLEDRS